MLLEARKDWEALFSLRLQTSKLKMIGTNPKSTKALDLKGGYPSSKYSVQFLLYSTFKYFVTVKPAARNVKTDCRWLP